MAVLAGCAEPVTVKPAELVVTSVLTLTRPGDATWDEALAFSEQHCCGFAPRERTNAGAVLDVRWQLDRRPAGPPRLEGSFAFFVRGPDPYGSPLRAFTDASGGSGGSNGGELTDLAEQHSFMEPVHRPEPQWL